MTESIGNLLDQYENGAITRRQLVKALLFLAVPGVAAASQAPGQAVATEAIIPVRSLNHWHINVADVKRSVDFYAQVFGAKVRASQPPRITTMTFPNNTSSMGSWISITTDRPRGVYSHGGFGVDYDNDRYHPRQIAERIRKAFPNVDPPAGGESKGDVPKGLGKRTSMHIFDPDGIDIQLLAKSDDGFLD